MPFYGPSGCADPAVYGGGGGGGGGVFTQLFASLSYILKFRVTIFLDN